MKKIGTALLAVFVAAQVFAQGIEFEKTTWNDVLQKAKNTHKVAFVDFYTTWCGPCKEMANHVFTNDTVGRFFNENFINFQMDAEKADGPNLANTYQISAYPSMVFIDAEGTLMYKIVGSQSVTDFMQHAERALKAINETENISYFKTNLASHMSDTSFLMKYYQKLGEMDKDQTAVFEYYIKALPEPVHATQFLFEKLQELSVPTDSFLFQWYVNHKAEFDQLDPKNKETGAAFCLSSMYSTLGTLAYYKDEVGFKKLLALDQQLFDGEHIDYLSEKYYEYTRNHAQHLVYVIRRIDQILKEGVAKIQSEQDLFFQSQHQRIQHQNADPIKREEAIKKFDQTFKNYIFRAKSDLISDAVFCMINESKRTKADDKKANAWIKFGLQLNPENHQLLSGYAQLLYTSGQRSKAILYIQKAVELAKKNKALNLNEYQGDLRKMKSRTFR